MPGVEVHATELLNLIRGDSLRASGRAWEITLLLCAAAFGGGLLWLRPVQAAVVALAGGGATFGMALVAFTHNLWFPWLIISAAQIPTALGISILFYSVDNS